MNRERELDYWVGITGTSTGVVMVAESKSVWMTCIGAVVTSVSLRWLIGAIARGRGRK